jgi:hypothetical protein
VDLIIDGFFLIDVFIIFNSALMDQNDVDLIEDRKKIAKSYLSGWFIVDILSIVPFELLFNSSYNKLARVARVGRLYKLVKLTKLIRILKVMKD